jgi:hypothetical protein
MHEFDTNASRPGGLERSDTWPASHHPFDGAVVPVRDVVEIVDLTYFNACSGRYLDRGCRSANMVQASLRLLKRGTPCHALPQSGWITGTSTI